MQRTGAMGMFQDELSIPTLSLSDTRSESFHRDLKLALSQFGFVAFVDHGLHQSLRDNALLEVEHFFALPAEEKLRTHRPGTAGARGYTGLGVEVAKDHSIADLKEFYHVGRERVRLLRSAIEPSSRQRKTLSQLPPNIWPRGKSIFRENLLQLYAHLEEIGMQVLSAIALILDQRVDYFDDKTDVGNSILRALHYPKLPADPGGAVRAAAHEDINLITLLIGSPQPGLEVLNKRGDWIKAPAGHDLIICNVGDMLERLSNGVLVSTTHRVVNPEPPYSERSRYSLPFFLHLNPDFLIESLSTCVTAERPNRYPEPILADDFLRQRLVEIGLI